MTDYSTWKKVYFTDVSAPRHREVRKDGGFYLTPGKPYEIEYIINGTATARIVDDEGDGISILLSKCPHLFGGTWLDWGDRPYRRKRPAGLYGKKHRKLNFT